MWALFISCLLPGFLHLELHSLCTKPAERTSETQIESKHTAHGEPSVGLSKCLNIAVETLLTLVFWGLSPPRPPHAAPWPRQTPRSSSLNLAFSPCCYGCGFSHLQCPQLFSAHLLRPAQLPPCLQDLPDAPQPAAFHWAAAAMSLVSCLSHVSCLSGTGLSHVPHV